MKTTFRFASCALFFYFGLATLLYSTETESFDALPVNTTGTASGWIYWAGKGTLDKLKVVPATTPALGVKQALSYDGDDIQVSKPFASEPDFGKSPRLYYVARFAPRLAGGRVQRVLFGALNRENKSVLLFGIATGEGNTFHLELNKKISESTFKGDNAYELCLILDLSHGPNNALGSLAVRNLSRSETEFTLVDGLQQVPIKFEPRTQPIHWNAWLLRFQYRQEIGQLSLSDTPSEFLPAP